ncbi:hypothetical protein Tco_0698520 [Tanacetum coccineum]
MSANDNFSLHDDEELSLHDDASLDGSVPASNKGDAFAKPPQIITTNTLSNIKLPVLQKDDYDTNGQDEWGLDQLVIDGVDETGGDNRELKFGFLGLGCRAGLYRELELIPEEVSHWSVVLRRGDSEWKLNEGVTIDVFMAMDDATEILGKQSRPLFGGNATEGECKMLVLNNSLRQFTISYKESLVKWLIDCGMSSTVKIGLGYGIQSNAEVLGYEEEMSRGIFDSGCSGHMTGNRAHLKDYQELSKVGSVTFGGSKVEYQALHGDKKGVPLGAQHDLYCFYVAVATNPMKEDSMKHACSSQSQTLPTQPPDPTLHLTHISITNTHHLFRITYTTNLSLNLPQLSTSLCGAVSCLRITFSPLTRTGSKCIMPRVDLLHKQVPKLISELIAWNWISNTKPSNHGK